MSPIALFGAGAVILLVGIGIGYLLGGAKGRKETEKAGALAAELDDYRRSVTEHFGQTAAHFQAIGAEYRKLYDHMASGESALCDTGKGVAFKQAALLERDAVEAPQEEAPSRPPRDYDVAEPDRADRELSDEAGGDVVAEPELEPTDAELAETEAVEELLTDRDLAVDDGEKTLH